MAQKVWRLWVSVFMHDRYSHAGNCTGLHSTGRAAQAKPYPICVETGCGQVAKLLGRVLRQERVDGIVSEVVVLEWSRSDRAGTARMGETREGRRRDREQRHSCDKHLFYRHLSHACMYTHMKMCSDKCAQQECMYTLRRTHCSHCNMCTAPSKICRRKKNSTFITP